MTEMEKNLKDLEEMYKLGMLDAEGYAFQKKQLEEEMAKSPSSEGAASAAFPESGQATPGSTATPPVQQTAAPSPSPDIPVFKIPKIHVTIAGKKLGEFEREEVIRRIRSGEIRKDARVWMDDIPDWVDAGELPELEKYFEEMKGLYETEERRKREEAGAAQRKQEAAAQAVEEAPMLYEKGQTASRLNNYAEAIMYFSKAGETGHISSCFNLIMGYKEGMYGLKRDYDKAEEWCKKAIAKNPDNPAQLEAIKTLLKEIEKKKGGLLSLFGKKK